MKRYWQKQYRRVKCRGVAADLPAHESRDWLTDCNFNAMRKSIEISGLTIRWKKPCIAQCPRTMMGKCHN